MIWPDDAEPQFSEEALAKLDSRMLAAQVTGAINGVTPPESIPSTGYDVGMCNDHPQTTIPGMDDPFDAVDSSSEDVAFRPIPADLSGLLASWAEDITAATKARHRRGLKPREVRAINAGLGEERVIYGIVAVLRDGLSSASATFKVIEDRIERIDADEAAAAEAGDKRLRKVHAVRAFTCRMLLVELRVSLAGGGFAVGVPLAAA